MSQEMTLEEARRLMATPKGHKYRAVRTEVDGMLFPSKRQAERYKSLTLLISSGDIQVEQVVEKYGRWMEVPFDLYGKNGGRVGRYTADFVYWDVKSQSLVVDETKGYKVRDYPMRKRIFKDNYPEFEFRET